MNTNVTGWWFQLFTNCSNELKITMGGERVNFYMCWESRFIFLSPGEFSVIALILCNPGLQVGRGELIVDCLRKPNNRISNLSSSVSLKKRRKQWTSQKFLLEMNVFLRIKQKGCIFLRATAEPEQCLAKLTSFSWVPSILTPKIHLVASFWELASMMP